jgi:hypothetical protein
LGHLEIDCGCLPFIGHSPNRYQKVLVLGAFRAESRRSFALGANVATLCSFFN